MQDKQIIVRKQRDDWHCYDSFIAVREKPIEAIPVTDDDNTEPTEEGCKSTQQNQEAKGINTINSFCS